MSKKASEAKQRILFRRARLEELYGKGMSELQLGKELGCSQQTVSTDLKAIRNRALTRMERFDERIPHEFDSMIAVVRQIIRRNCVIADNEESTEKQRDNAEYKILKCVDELRNLQIDKSNIQEALEMRSVFNRLSPSLEALKERQMREAYEKTKQRSQAIF